MRILWIGPDRDATFAETSAALRSDVRTTAFDVRTIETTTLQALDELVRSADGIVLAVHHFEPTTCAWFHALLSGCEPERWRAVLGPFAATAGRVPFDALHRQAFLAANGRFAAPRWLGDSTPRVNEGVTSSSRHAEAAPAARILIWSPSEDRSGVDPQTFAVPSASADVRLVTPRDFGLPFGPDAVVAWIPAGLGREERVHLGQLRSATPSVAWIATYASPSAKAAAPIRADQTLVWPFALGDLRVAVERARTDARVTAATRAA